MAKGASKISGGSGAGAGAGATLSNGTVSLDLTNEEKLTKQLATLPIGSMLKRIDNDDNTELRLLKTSDSNVDPNSWGVYTFFKGASNPTDVNFDYTDNDVAKVLIAGNKLKSKMSIYRIGT